MYKKKKKTKIENQFEISHLSTLDKISKLHIFTAIYSIEKTSRKIKFMVIKKIKHTVIKNSLLRGINKEVASININKIFVIKTKFFFKYSLLEYVSITCDFRI